MKEYVSVKSQLDHLNNVLARLQKAEKAVEAVQAAMHVAPHTEADKEARVLRRMLKNTGETNSGWEKKKKAGKNVFKQFRSAFSYKTFELRDLSEFKDKTNRLNQYKGIAQKFSKQVKDSVKAIEACRELLGPDVIDFKDGHFNRTQSIVWVESAIESRIAEVKSYMHAIKREYNREKLYLAVVETGLIFKTEDFDFFRSERLKQWADSLAKKNKMFSVRYQQLMRISKASAPDQMLKEVVESYKKSDSDASALTYDSVMDVLKGKYDADTKYDYLVELRSAMDESQFDDNAIVTGSDVFKSWVKQLRHNTTLNQRYHEYLATSQGEGKVERELDASQRLYNEVIAAYKAATAMDEESTWREVMKAIKRDLDNGKRIYINIKLNEEKDKYREDAVSMWTTLFSTVSTAGESVLGAYSMATALGATTGVAFLASLQANPALMAATIATFLSVLVVNQSLFDKQVKDLFTMLVKGELFKNKDGSSKTAKEKALLVGGMFVAVVSGALMAVITYNACINAFSSLLALPSTAPAVIAIAIAVAGIEFVALTGFNFQFFNGMFSDLKTFNKTMNRLYFQGRSKVGKGFLFAANLIMTVFFTMGSLIVGKSSLKEFFDSFNTSMPALNWSLQGMSSSYYLSASVVVMNAMIIAMRKKLSGAKRFFKEAKPGEIAARIAIDIFVGLPKQMLFFAVTCALSVLRVLVNLLKIVAVVVVNASIATCLPLLAVGVHALRTGQKFSKVLKQYTSAPQKAAGAINKALPAWNVMYRESLDKAGSLPILANASSNAALNIDGATAMLKTADPATQGLILGSTGPSTLTKFAVSAFANTGARDEFIHGSKVEEGVSAREDAKAESTSQYCPKRYLKSMFSFGKSKNHIGHDVSKLIDLGKDLDEGPQAGA